MRQQDQPHASAPARLYGFEFASFDLDMFDAAEEAPSKPHVAKRRGKTDPADEIDYGPMHRAIQRDREWYRSSRPDQPG